ncbi:DUF4880 domain-containing protein [Sphingomonas suaedae]|uniref:DUF4880 domain-containing protein n=1 Tax=Sphingomonas suaedae TaxID=2599297 RepID=A0A518RHP9_9SPHN|nr:FecR domain-containing protein [Sphingomonas suaedae]QDX26939.1 DUF4880 domain-containing protein [Sphingomonas suaedae]
MKREPDPREEAASWVHRLDQPAIDASLGPKFDRWLAASDGNADTFADVQALWESDTLKQALRESSEATTSTVVAAPRGDLSRFRFRASAIAAAACAVLVVATVLISDLSFATYQAGVGEDRAIVLADGSRVDLSGGSKLRVQILPWQRTATLERGEAFFNIQHEPSRAFRVHSGNTSVRVLGTAFNVDRQSATRTTVEVYRGAVEVDIGGTRQMVLRKGEQTRVAEGSVILRSHSTRQAPDWKSGWFEADNVPLEVLITKVQRYSSRPIVFGNDELAARPISGRFQVSDPARVLTAIRQAYGVKVQSRGEQIRISSEPTESTRP